MNLDAENHLAGATRYAPDAWQTGLVGDLRATELDAGRWSVWWASISDPNRIIRFEAESRDDSDEVVRFLDGAGEVMAEFRTVEAEPAVQDTFLARDVIDRWRAETLGTPQYASFLESQGVGADE